LKGRGFVRGVVKGPKKDYQRDIKKSPRTKRRCHKSLTKGTEDWNAAERQIRPSDKNLEEKPLVERVRSGNILGSGKKRGCFVRKKKTRGKIRAEKPF